MLFGMAMWVATMKLHGFAPFCGPSVEEVRMFLDSKKLDYTHKMYKTGWFARTYVFEIRHEDPDYLEKMAALIVKWADQEEQ